MQEAHSYIYILYLAIAIGLDVFSNIFMKLSNGFKNKKYSIIAIISILLAFTSLSFAIKHIELSIAYGLWGGLGLIATALAGIFIFNERLRLVGWFGVLLIVAGVALLETSI